tara:strand:+ start:1754 stop:2287 length:534 start_codon:yes stop_codon:yes gene_type:complete
MIDSRAGNLRADSLLPCAVDLYIGLGSNLDAPIQQVQQALLELASLPHTEMISHSQLYRSDPLGPADQPDYINAVAHLRSRLQPEPLLDQLQALEQKHQRVRLQHWGPRTLDLDILLFGKQQIATARLSVPHPQLSQRNFVLYPLQEIAPELQLPQGKSIAQLITHCDRGTLAPVQV